MLDTLILFGIALTVIKVFYTAASWVFVKLRVVLPKKVFIAIVAGFALLIVKEYTRAAILVRLVIDSEDYSLNASLILGSLAIASTILFHWANEIRLKVNGSARGELLLSRYGCLLQLCMFFFLLACPQLTTNLFIAVFTDTIYWLHVHPWAGIVMAFPGVAFELSFAVGAAFQLRRQCIANKA